MRVTGLFALLVVLLAHASLAHLLHSDSEALEFEIDSDIEAAAGTCTNSFATPDCAEDKTWKGTSPQKAYLALKALAPKVDEMCQAVSKLGISMTTTTTSTESAGLKSAGNQCKFPSGVTTTVSYSTDFIATFALSTSFDAVAAGASFTFTATGSISTASTNTIAKLVAQYVPSLTFTFTFDGASQWYKFSAVTNIPLTSRTTLTNLELTLVLPGLPTSVASFIPSASGAMSTSSCIQAGAGMAGIGVLMSVQTKIGDDPIVLSAAVGVSTSFALGTLSMCVSYAGTVNNAFGIKGFSLSNFAGSVGLAWTYAPPTPSLSSLAFTATAGIGSFSATVAFSYSSNPLNDYVYMKLNSDLTLGMVLSGFGLNSLPADFSNIGFQAGSYFSCSALAQTVSDASGNSLSIPAGTFMLAKLRLFGCSKKACELDVSFAFTYSIVSSEVQTKQTGTVAFSPLNLYGLQIYGSSARNSGPSLSMTATSSVGAAGVSGSFAASASVFITCTQFPAGLSGSWSMDMAGATTFSVWGSLLNSITASVTVSFPSSIYAAATGTGMSFSASISMSDMQNSGDLSEGLKTIGNALPAINWGPSWVSACDKMFTNLCSKYQDMRSALIQGSASGVSVSASVSGKVGDSSSSFSAKLQYSISISGFGVSGSLDFTYSASYKLRNAIGGLASSLKSNAYDYVNSKYSKVKDCVQNSFAC